MVAGELSVTPITRGWQGEFSAMASPCQLLLDGGDEVSARYLAGLVHDEARRIEQKFSRYRSDNIIHEINTAAGKFVSVDDETVLLLDFANQCFELSDGLFDVTSGVLRQAWTFDGSDRLPASSDVTNLLQRVGWEKVKWQAPAIRLQPGMEIDLGGIGKEYAVDRCHQLLSEKTSLPFLLNFGGDLRVSGLRHDGMPWAVGVEHPAVEHLAHALIELRAGALATSGDARRFLLRDGQRYGHILNPKTGWPVENAPRSVTVAAPTTVEAGVLATFALLQGAGAEGFLQDQEVQFWLY